MVRYSLGKNSGGSWIHNPPVREVIISVNIPHHCYCYWCCCLRYRFSPSFTPCGICCRVIFFTPLAISTYVRYLTWILCVLRCVTCDSRKQHKKYDKLNCDKYLSLRSKITIATDILIGFIIIVFVINHLLIVSRVNPFTHPAHNHTEWKYRRSLEVTQRWHAHYPSTKCETFRFTCHWGMGTFH